mgnify:CR=1 FL=1
MNKIFKKRRESGEINWVWIAAGSVLFIGGYLIMTFIPPWYKSLQAKEQVGEVLSGTSTAALEEEHFRETVKGRLAKIGVDVDEADVELTVDRENKRVIAKVVWRAVIKYPFTRKTRNMTFNIVVKRKTGL